MELQNGFGYRMLAEAIKADLPYRISCPALLICGEKYKAGSAKRYNGIRGFISGIIAVISVLVILAGTYMTSSGIKNCK
mgnify:CR=1 FL=1